ncbi:hypothetical protein BS78_K227400 [Paspalum vaginatum]|uniref:Uncharacterized protein n=1 Tax=Paspalum vaginatum TaxID=158149 RepID=A0A9W7X7M1_9POAL|nr:hypothetical protein BS78_K227400 [Paspalum vaginatum]
MSIFVMSASWAIMFDYLFLLLRMRLIFLILYTVTCGPLLYTAFLVISTIWWCWMISLIILGLFLCASSLWCSPRSPTSSLRCPLSSALPLRPSSVTTGVSSITPPPALSSYLTVSSCACLVPIPPLRTARLSGGFAPLMMSCAPFCSRPLFLLASGQRVSTLPPTCSTA